MLKIAICTPHYGDVTPEYSRCLARLVFKTAQTEVTFNSEVGLPQIEVFMYSSSLLTRSRTLLVSLAENWGANYLLWVDADHWFPDDTLLRLLSHNLPVVGANYPTRLPPHTPTAFGLYGKDVAPTAEAAKAGQVLRVQSMGFGCCLVDMSVFGTIREHALASGKQAVGPLFAMETMDDGTIVGEDVFFFRRLKDAGIAAHVDQALSWDIGHVTRQVVTFGDTLASR